MTAIMKSDFRRKPASEIDHPKPIDQELRKLIDPARQRKGRFLFGMTFENLRVKDPDHCSVRAGRDYDYLCVLQSIDHTDGNISRLISAARVECGLPATDNRFVEADRVTKLFKNSNQADSDRGEQLVDKARNEQ